MHLAANDRTEPKDDLRWIIHSNKYCRHNKDFLNKRRKADLQGFDVKGSKLFPLNPPTVFHLALIGVALFAALAVQCGWRWRVTLFFRWWRFLPRFFGVCQIGWKFQFFSIRNRSWWRSDCTSYRSGLWWRPAFRGHWNGAYFRGDFLCCGLRCRVPIVSATFQKAAWDHLFTSGSQGKTCAFHLRWDLA